MPKKTRHWVRLEGKKCPVSTVPDSFLYPPCLNSKSVIRYSWFFLNHPYRRAASEALLLNAVPSLISSHFSQEHQPKWGISCQPKTYWPTWPIVHYLKENERIIIGWWQTENIDFSGRSLFLLELISSLCRITDVYKGIAINDFTLYLGGIKILVRLYVDN